MRKRNTERNRNREMRGIMLVSSLESTCCCCLSLHLSMSEKMIENRRKDRDHHGDSSKRGQEEKQKDTKGEMGKKDGMS